MKVEVSSKVPRDWDEYVAGEFAAERNAKHVELRRKNAVSGLSLPERLDKVSMVLPLPGDEDVLSKSLGSKLRAQIRRAERENPVVVWGGKELVAKFYSVFSPSMHGLGTPVLPRKFFEINFGRSTVDSGTYRFKKQWGAVPRQLRWYYWLPEGASIPTLNQSNPKFELAIRAWQRMPLWCANLVGPRILRNLP